VPTNEKMTLLFVAAVGILGGARGLAIVGLMLANRAPFLIVSTRQGRWFGRSLRRTMPAPLHNTPTMISLYLTFDNSRILINKYQCYGQPRRNG
jgi:hypothetical protein